MGHLHLFDLLIVGGYMVLTVLIGLAFTRHGSKNTDNYFLSGRSLVWWVAGLSMVATNFASDTPL
jgi:solute:Na+ symporter, SSS family